MALYCRSAVECITNLEKMPSNKKQGSKSTLRHWLGAIADRKQGFPIRHEGYTPREVYAKPQNV